MSTLIGLRNKLLNKEANRNHINRLEGDIGDMEAKKNRVNVNEVWKAFKKFWPSYKNKNETYYRSERNLFLTL